MDQYVKDPSQILTQLTGTPGLAAPDIAPPERTARLNTAAITSLEDMQRLGLDHEDKRRATAQAAQQAGKHFDPLEAEAKRQLTGVWEQDLADIPEQYWLV